jgi:nucleoside-diphosphate-sugar epimerase
MLLDNLTGEAALGGRLGSVRRALGALPLLKPPPLPKPPPLLKPVLPDTGVKFQLVHHDDVASAVCAAVLGRGRPGVYNLAGDGTLTTGDLARELGWHTLPVPKQVVGVASDIVSRAPLMPTRASWLTAFRRPVLMDTTKARTELDWRPQYDSRETLQAMIAAKRPRR